VLAIGGFVWYQATPADTAGQPVVIAYQTGVDPGKLAQADGDYERNSNRAIEWKKFDSGSDVVNALASGNVVIGNIGSSPFAAAASRNLPIDTFLITSRLGDSEALVVSNRSGIKEPRDLIGKTIAVPFVSTTHYSLLCALKNWGISEDQTKIINLRPPEIAAAWARGDIDATYVWEPVLGKVKANGTVLTEGDPDTIANDPQVKAVYLGHGEGSSDAGPPQGARAPLGGSEPRAAGSVGAGGSHV
jgi:taurine transport system substrate-binding protein